MPRDLVKIDLDKLKAYIIQKLSSFDEIAGVYLFGSSLDLMRPDSDIDIGIIFYDFVDEEKAEDIIETLYLKLLNFEGHPFDIRSVNHSNTIIAFNILRNGLPVLVKDEDAVTDLIEKVSLKYKEVYPQYKRAVEMILEGLK
ncbi:MAG: nucleotidyltransferase domain-containing protein [Thermovenabulum sp.]|uniref:nucleotidyltransferase domain-containing protein n=1 Tax=Thermovenabulum sp. TaxID=3100335 RepID=UPI003C7E3257